LDAAVGVQSWRASSGHEVVVGVEIKSGAELQGASRLTTTRAQPHKPCTVATTEAFASSCIWTIESSKRVTV
jgi:hypothetical protein